MMTLRLNEMENEKIESEKKIEAEREVREEEEGEGVNGMITEE